MGNNVLWSDDTEVELFGHNTRSNTRKNKTKQKNPHSTSPKGNHLHGDVWEWQHHALVRLFLSWNLTLIRGGGNTE